MKIEHKITNTLFLFLLLAISCTHKKPDPQTAEFEKALGLENAATLAFLVDDFENDFLKRQYPDVDTESAYRQFLKELSEGETQNWKPLSQKAEKTFKKSDLRLEMYKFPDSAWILQNSTFDKIESDSIVFFDNPLPYVKSRFTYTNPDGTIEYSYSRDPEIDLNEEDSAAIIKRALNTMRFKYAGKYLKALETLKEKSPFHKEFYDLKKETEVLLPRNTADAMLHYNIDLNDPLNKKLIVLELVY